MVTCLHSGDPRIVSLNPLRPVNGSEMTSSLVKQPGDVASRPLTEVNGPEGGLDCQAAFAAVADLFLGFLTAG